MRKLLILLLVALTSNLVEAQFIKEKSINAQIGYGITLPYNSIDDVVSGGFFMQGEYVLKVYSWLDLKPYAGFVITNSNGKDINENPTLEGAETTAFMLGGKIRLKAPIPYVAPFLEFGIGTSIGKFDTFTAYHNIDKSGITYHIPFVIGLELGKNNNVDLSIASYYHPEVKQYIGAIAIGLKIPLNSNNK